MLWKLVWQLGRRPDDYKKVVRMEPVPIPPCPRPIDALVTPQEVDLSPLVISAQHALHEQRFIDLTAHPEYPKTTHALLLASDRIVILPAYTKLYERACYLNERYKAFVPGGELGYQPPPRHFVLTGIPGIGKYRSQTYIPQIRLIIYIGKSYAQSVLLFNRLAEGKITACQPFELARTGYYLFSNDGVKFITTGSSDEDRAMCENKDIWVLCDDDPLIEFNSYWTRDWMVVWTTSPGRLKESRWRKEQQGEVWAMAEWRWPEVVSLRYVRNFHCLVYSSSHFPRATEQALEVTTLTIVQRASSSWGNTPTRTGSSMG